MLVSTYGSVDNISIYKCIWMKIITSLPEKYCYHLKRLNNSFYCLEQFILLFSQTIMCRG